MTVHKVKSWTHLFQAAKSGAKKHDFRDATERDYKVGDQLLLQEFDFVNGVYTGDELVVNITYKTGRETPCALSSNGLAQNMCVLSIEIA
jgi:hypothetical protein